MLQAQLYEQCSEQIHSYAYGDSLHMRFIVLYTAYKRLIVIAENKYSLKKKIQLLSWEGDPIISMKFSTFILHILTLNGEYIQLKLGEVFNENYDLQHSIAKVNISQLPQLNSQALNNVFKSFTDFLLAKKRVIFLTQSGAIIIYDTEKRVISQIIQMKMLINQYIMCELDGKEHFIAITELNDVVKLVLHQETEQYIHRFSDSKFSIKQIFFIGQGNILLIQESKQNARFVKYSLKKLEFIEEYALPEHDQNIKYLEIHELQKLFICLVFDVNKFKIISISKKILKSMFHKDIQINTPILYDGEKEFNFKEIFNFNMSSITSSLEFPNQLLHLSKFNQSFGIKVTKSQVLNTLHTEQYILEQDQDNYQNLCSILVTSTQIYIITLMANLPQMINLNASFNNLQYLENYQRTIGQCKIKYSKWQDQIILWMWNKLHCEMGISQYFQFKNTTDQEIIYWVNQVKTEKSVYDTFLDLERNSIYLESQYDKCLATMGLLHFKNLSNEMSISKIIALLFQKLNVPCYEIIHENSQQILRIFQFMKFNSSLILNYEYWKDSQQLFFLLINILDVWLSEKIQLYDVLSDNSTRFIIPEDIEDHKFQSLEPIFLKKIRKLVLSERVPVKLRLSLIIFTQDQKYLKILTYLVQQIENKREYRELVESCDPYNHLPTFNVQSIQLLLQDCDQNYLSNLIKLTENRFNEVEMKQPNELSVFILNHFTNRMIETDYYRLMEWFIN